MSWHFQFHVKSPSALGRALSDEAITGAQFPQAIRTAVSLAADELLRVLPQGKMLFVSSSGHIDSWGGNAMLDIRIVNGPLE